MFYGLYVDQDITLGGLFFNPDDNGMIEVIDMESASGQRGVIYVERGSLHVDEERMRRAVESSGYFHVESPPEVPQGRKRWLSVPWTPTPEPGYLFWVPRPPLGPKILEAWEAWSEHLEEGGKFEELPEETKKLIFLGARAVLDYSGISEGETHVVIKKYPGAEKWKDHDYPNAIISKNPEAAIWKILKQMGVRKDA